MKVLVTGGAGFIGSYVVEALVERGYSARVFDNLDPQVHGLKGGAPAYLHPQAEWVSGDVRDGEAVGRALEGVEAVVHYAAAVGVGQSMYRIVHYMEVNTVGTARLLETLINRTPRIRKLIVASSMSIYGEGKYTCPHCGVVDPSERPWLSNSQPPTGNPPLGTPHWEQRCPPCGGEALPLPTDEAKPLQPNSPYAISKKDQEELSLVIGRAYRLPTVALRFFNVYGPRQALSNPYTGAAAIFASRLLNGNPPVVYEDGLQTRDFVHVRDIARATLLALESSEGDYEAFNVGTGRATAILHLARMLCERLNPRLQPQVEGKFRAGDIRHCYADITKIRERLGFEPSVRFEEGLGDLVGWVKTQVAEDRFAQAAAELQAKGLV